MPSIHSDRLSVPAIRALCFVFIALLAGCASKNPLMEEPVAAGTSQARPSAAPTRTATATTDSPSTAPTGVQTIQERRFLGFLSPYRVAIQQGNFVSQEMVAQLKEGMTPDQVRFALGTPLLTDIFHANRWDYVFRLKKGNGEVTTSRVTVFFKDNRLARFEGGDLPTEQDYLNRLAGAAPKPAPKPAPPTDAPKTAPSSANEPK
jgi:outer membrane protein assembly factor BamE